MNTTQLFPPCTTALLIVLTCVIVAACEQPTAIKQGYSDITSAQWHLDTTLPVGHIWCDGGYAKQNMIAMKFNKDSTVTISQTNGKGVVYKWHFFSVDTGKKTVLFIRFLSPTGERLWEQHIISLTRDNLELAPPEPTPDTIYICTTYRYHPSPN